MKNNKFVIITPCYNVGKWLPINIQMTKYQSYQNFDAVFIDDASTDNTFEILSQNCDRPNLHYFRNDNNGSQAKAFMSGISHMESKGLLNDEDIIVEIDGDDWLSSVFVLDYLNRIYQNDKIWMTYGQYQIYPSGNVGGHYGMKFQNENHRLNPFPFSHLKSYKYHLFNRISGKDLVDPETLEYYSTAFDHVLCIPMVEMAGIDRIHRCEDILYILNRDPSNNNEGTRAVQKQKETEAKVRKLQPYEKIK